MYGGDARLARATNLVDAQWTSSSGRTQRTRKTGMGYQSIGGSNPPSPLELVRFPGHQLGTRAASNASTGARRWVNWGQLRALSRGSSFPPPFPQVAARGPSTFLELRSRLRRS